jgi:hypothetical protein
MNTRRITRSTLGEEPGRLSRRGRLDVNERFTVEADHWLRRARRARSAWSGVMGASACMEFQRMESSESGLSSLSIS